VNSEESRSAPFVVVVGRPNVGKSTLVNLLTGRTVSVVADIPAVTRDRIVTEARLGGRSVTVIDTGGFIIDPGDNVGSLVMEQLRLAVEEADLILCLFDASESPSLLDEEIVRFLRRRGRTVLYAANKCDRKASDSCVHEYHALGPGDIVAISAAHNTGIGELTDAIVAHLPPPREGEAAEKGGRAYDARVLVLGRPNAGKSTLINTVIGADRLIVDPRPGTTRDCIEIPARVAGRSVLIVDSAGIRRPRSTGRYLEEMIVIRAIRAIAGADVALFLVDSREGIVQQDERLMSIVLRRGRGLAVGFNKWDLMKKVRFETYVKDIPSLREFLTFIPAVPVSGLTGWNIDELFRVVFRIKEGLRMRIATSQLNRFLEEIMTKHPPPRVRGRPVKIYYVAQTGENPPVFSFVANRPADIAESWKRYAAGELRGAFGFTGVPVRRSRKKGGNNEKNDDRYDMDRGRPSPFPFPGFPAGVRRECFTAGRRRAARRRLHARR
jgi:GTP-binding protein